MILTCAYGCVRTFHSCRHSRFRDKEGEWRVWRGRPTNAQLVEATGGDLELLKLVRKRGSYAQDPQRLRANGLREDVLSVELFLEQGGEAAEETISEAAENMWPSRTDRSPERIRRALKRIEGKSVRELADQTGLPKSTIHDVISRWKEGLKMTKLEELLTRQEQTQIRQERLQREWLVTKAGLDDVCQRLKAQFPNDSEVAKAVEQFLEGIQH